MTKRSDTPWKTIAIVLALALAIVLICAALVLSGMANLAFSLM